MPTGISVIVCCFNSANRLDPTLQHLVDQKNIPLSSWEVILVDNCSTDGTSEKAAHLWASFNSAKPNFKIVAENTPGLSAARHKGISESKFDYVLFCDDDNWLDENYLSIAVAIMQSNAGIGALGGTGSPVFEKNEPPYFWVNQYHALATGDQSTIDGDITDERGVLYGAGMVLNKNAYRTLKEKFQFEFRVSDRINNSLISSGDHELCLALRKIGYRIFCSNRLKFKHYIPESRTKIVYYKKLFYGFGLSYAMLHVYRVNKNNFNSIKNDYRYIALRCLKTIFLVNGKLLLNGYYLNSNKYRYLAQLHSLYNALGQFKAIIKVKNIYKREFSALPLFKDNI